MKRIVLVVLAILCASLLATACGGGGDDGGEGGAEAADEGSGPILIGNAGSQTGFMAAFDIPARHGAEIAVQDINDAGGVLGRQLEIIYCDSKTDIAQSAQCAQELISKGAKMLIATCTYDIGAPAARVADEQNILSFSCAAAHEHGVQGIGKNAFSISQGAVTEGAVMAEFASKELGARTAYLLNDTALEYSKSFCEWFKSRFTELGGEIIGEDTFANTDPSIAPQISNIRNASPQPDVIAYCSYPPGGAVGIRQLRNAGITTPLVGTTAFDGSFWLDAVPNLSDFYYPTPGSIFGDDPDDKWQEFVRKYRERTDEDPASGNYPGSGYSIVEGWAKSVEEVGTLDTDEVRGFIESWNEFEIFNGPTTYGPEQHQAWGRPMKIIEIQNGENRFMMEFELEKVPQPYG